MLSLTLDDAGPGPAMEDSAPLRSFPVTMQRLAKICLSDRPQTCFSVLDLIRTPVLRSLKIRHEGLCLPGFCQLPAIRTTPPGADRLDLNIGADGFQIEFILKSELEDDANPAHFTYEHSHYLLEEEDLGRDAEEQKPVLSIIRHWDLSGITILALGVDSGLQKLLPEPFMVAVFQAMPNLEVICFVDWSENGIEGGNIIDALSQLHKPDIDDCAQLYPSPLPRLRGVCFRSVTFTTSAIEKLCAILRRRVDLHCGLVSLTFQLCQGADDKAVLQGLLGAFVPLLEVTRKKKERW